MRWIAVIENILFFCQLLVLAELTTYLAPIFAGAAATVRMMRTHKISMKVTMAKMETIYKQ